MLAAAAGPDRGPGWSAGNKIALNLDTPASIDASHYLFNVAANGDRMIDAVEMIDRKASRVRIVLIDGKLAAVTNSDGAAGSELDALEASRLMWHLTEQLLDRGLPQGPKSVARSKQFDIRETKSPIRVGTGAAGGSIPPPWSVKGEAHPGVGSAILYKLDFRASSPEPTDLKLWGSWSRDDPAPEIPDSVSLDGWNIYALEESPRLLSEKFSNVGELRKFAAAAKR
jgi:hypothetical protein